jgi:Peptidase M50B-like
VKRLDQVILIGSGLPLSWLVMMAVHESGHVVGAYLTGGTVAKVILHPLTISRTDLSDNPHPLLVAWAGPILGTVLPLVVFALAALARLPGAFLFRFFAGFCLIANGVYIGVGSFEGIGDAGDLLRHGSRIWLLWAFGGVTIPPGLFCWHNQGRHFGMGQADGKVSRGAALTCLALLILVLTVEFLFGSR